MEVEELFLVNRTKQKIQRAGLGTGLSFGLWRLLPLVKLTVTIEFIELAWNVGKTGEERSTYRCFDNFNSILG